VKTSMRSIHAVRESIPDAMDEAMATAEPALRPDHERGK